MNIVFYKDEFTDESKYDEFSDNVCDILRAINPDKYAKKMGYERI